MNDVGKVALRATARIAFRYFEGLTEQEREQVLLTLIEVLPGNEGEIAAQALFHLRKQHDAQLTLKSILEGGGK